MKYVVIVTPEAQANIAAALRFIAERAPLNAVKWLRDLDDQIDSLELFPRRFGQAREQSEVASHFESQSSNSTKRGEYDRIPHRQSVSSWRPRSIQYLWRTRGLNLPTAPELRHV